MSIVLRRTPRTEYSYLGMASFLLSVFPGVLLVSAWGLVQLILRSSPPGAEQTGAAGIMIFLLLLTVPLELVALGLGVVGAFQRRRGRSLAFAGLACSVLVLALINIEVGFVDVARFTAGMMEGQP